MATLPVDVAFFDVVETLFSLEAVARCLRAAGAGEGALELWFARFLRDGFALAASGGYRPFREVAGSALVGVLRARGVDSDDAAVDEILSALGELDAHPDARPALEDLCARGVRVMTLSNGAADTTDRLLTRAGLRPLVERTLSADAVRLWKPRPEPYLAACAAAAVAPSRAVLVAVHSWDVQGAAAAGLRTGWCSRLEGELPRVFTPPTVRGATLVDVAARLGT